MDEGRFCVLSAYDMNGVPSSLDARGGGTAGTNTATATTTPGGAVTTTCTGSTGGGDADLASSSTRTRSVCARACSSFSRLGRWNLLDLRRNQECMTA